MPDPGANTTIIAADTHIKGEMTFDHTARLLGTFEGSITAKGELQVAESAVCKASVEVGKITVEGTVDGNITARERVELTAKSKLKGDIVTPRLVVAEGASFEGHVKVGQDAANRAARPSEPAVVIEGRAPAGGAAAKTDGREATVKR